MRNEYIVDSVSFDKLSEVVDFGHKMVGNSHIDLTTLKGRYQINQEIVQCLFKRMKNGHKGELVGYYIIYFLNKQATDSIKRLEIINGRGLTNSCFESNSLNASSLYIGMMGAVGSKNMVFLLKTFIIQLKNLLNNNKNLEAVFTRGATKSGKRVIGGFNFKALDGKSEISAISFDNKTSALERLERHLKRNEGSVFI